MLNIFCNISECWSKLASNEEIMLAAFGSRAFMIENNCFFTQERIWDQIEWPTKVVRTQESHE